MQVLGFPIELQWQQLAASSPANIQSNQYTQVKTLKIN
jgi:hypothetical protein